MFKKLIWLIILPVVVSKDHSNVISHSKSNNCRKSLMEYLIGLKQTKPWALQMLDSSGKIPEGILYGNSRSLGLFDECINLKHPDNHFAGQYCLLHTTLNLFTNSQNKVFQHMNEYIQYLKNSMGNSLIGKQFKDVPVLTLFPTIKTFGICLPSTCSYKEIETGVNFVLNRLFRNNSAKAKLIPERCRTIQSRKLKATDWIVVGVLIAFGITALVSTFYDVFQRFFLQNKKPNALLIAFSLYSNGKYLFSISENSSQLEALHGIRVLSILWIVLCHELQNFAIAPSVNYLNRLIKELKDNDHVFITNGFLAVDSFLFLSGMLVCLTFFLEINSTGSYDFPLRCIHRYIRLTPPLLIVILIRGTIFFYIGDGPLWYNFHGLGAGICGKNWWKEVLYIQTSGNVLTNCAPQAWYLSVDMQLFVLSPLVLYFMFFFPTAAPLFLIALTIIATAATFLTVYINDLGPSPFVSRRMMLQFDLEYARFYSRASPYIIGIATAYIICGVQAKRIKINISPFCLCVGWLAAAGLMHGALYGITAFTVFQYTRLEAAFYASLSRVMWAFGLAWMVITSATGYGGPINGFLSWNFFQPLGKLSYSVFLTHILVIGYRVGSMRTVFYGGDIELAWYYLADLTVSFLLAIPLTLIIEMPFRNIARYFFKNLSLLPLPRRTEEMENSDIKSEEFK